MSEFDKIIGYKDVKEELVRLCDVIKNGEKYKALGVSPIGGLLLDGKPGVGKTLMANCFIKESGRMSYVCRKNKPDGEFVNEIKNTFLEAEKTLLRLFFLTIWINLPMKTIIIGMPKNTLPFSLA